MWRELGRELNKHNAAFVLVLHHFYNALKEVVTNKVKAVS